MINHLRRQYNDQFTNEAYRAMLDWMGGQYGELPKFEVAETPVFIPGYLRDRLLEACEDLLTVITREDFAERAKSAIPPGGRGGRAERPPFVHAV